jgi:putative membrane protein
VSRHRGFLDELAPEPPQISSAGKRGWIDAYPQGNRGPISHDSVAVLADDNLDEDTLTPLSIGVIGLLSLIVGVAILELGNFTAAQFDRAPWLGWLTVALLAPACAAVLWSAVREWRGLAALKTADEVRAGLRSEDLKVARSQADNWLKAIRATPEEVSSVQSAEDAETLRSLLRTGPLAKLDQEVSASGRAAALRVLAATAVSPWPGLDGVIVIWQSLRLVGHVARLYGLRPGALGTLRLLRHATTDATTVAATEVAVAVLTEAVLNSPLGGALVGQATGSAIAAHRILRLTSTIAQSCRPIPWSNSPHTT